LTLAQAMVVSQPSTAVANTVPAGGALALGVSYRFYGSWGFSRPAITRNVLLTGAWNLLCKLGLPLVVLVVVVATGQANKGVIAAALLGLVVLLLALGVGGTALASEPFARRIGAVVGAAVTRVRGWVHRSTPGGGAAVAVRFRLDTLRLLRRRAGRLTTSMVLYHASVFAVLLLSLRGVGVGAGQVSLIDAMAAFSLARLASAVPVTPGGIGLVDVGLAGSLIAAGGPHTGVVAGVLVFRTLSFFPPLPLGLITYVVWRKKNAWRQTSAKGSALVDP
jgi:putative heme transporter